MKKLFVLASCVALCGCAGAGRKGMARTDAFEGVRFEQMRGNSVSAAPLQRTIVCLNARRESRFLPATTNYVVTYLTNQVVSYLTNYQSATVTNLMANISTNQLTPVAPPIPVDTNDAAAVVVAAPPAQGASTNVSVTRTADNTVTVNSGKDQSATSYNSQSSVTVNHQLTVTLGNQALTIASNQTVRYETSLIVTAVTNYQVTAVTNPVIASPSHLAHEHFLYTELTPPPEFVLAGGESLVLLVDGCRYGFTATNSPSFVGRRGFVSTLYRVPAEVIVAIANANEVKMRIRGTTMVIERELNRGSRENFRKFLLTHYSPKATVENLQPRAEEPAPASRSRPGASAHTP